MAVVCRDETEIEEGVAWIRDATPPDAVPCFDAGSPRHALSTLLFGLLRKDLDSAGDPFVLKIFGSLAPEENKKIF